MPRNQFMLMSAGLSCSAPPLDMSGMAELMPPSPVVTPTPAPSRRNQVSIVKSVVLSPGFAPKVT